MFRIEHSPEKPMLAAGPAGRTTSPPSEAILCQRGEAARDPLLLPLPYRNVRFEPDPAKAIAAALEGRTSCLVMDLSHLSPPAFSSLALLRLMRPGLRILLLDDGTEKVCLRGTALEGLSRVPTWRGRPEAHRNGARRSHDPI